jgi:hypothetical protein
MRDMRQYPRVALRISAWCESDRWTLRTAIVDASEGGLRLRGCPAQPAGTKLKVSFRDPGGAHVVATTEVIWSVDDKRAESGLRLLELHEGEPEYAELLATYRR